VYTIQVFALRGGAQSSSDCNDLARYQLNVEPDSDLGLELGELFKPHIGLSSCDVRPSQTKDVESLLREIDDLVLEHPTAMWRAFPIDDQESITQDEIRKIALERSDAYLLRVLPSFHEFVTDRLSISRKFVSTKSTEHRHFVLTAMLNPKDESGSLELLTQDRFGKILDREHFKMQLQEPAPEAWLQEVAHRVYNRGQGASTTPRVVNERESLHQLLNQTVDSAVEFHRRGPGAIRRMFPRSETHGQARGVFLHGGTLPEERARDLNILEGLIDLEANQLSEDVELKRFLNNGEGFGSHVHLEIGDKVARVSVNAGSREGCATVAWYLRNETPFSAGDTAKLERLWKAAEMLRDRSEGAIYTALEELCELCIPKYQGVSDPQDVVDFNVHGIDGIVFTPVTPVLFGQMARVVEGIEDIDANVITEDFRRNYPQNFHKMRFSLHNDGALSIQAVNSLKGRVNAFIPASGFQEGESSRSAVIERLSTFMVRRPENARRDVQGAVTSLAATSKGWCSSIGNEIDAPGLANDLPPLSATRGDRAYEHTVKIAKMFAEITGADIASFKIRLIKEGSLRPTACHIGLTEPLTDTGLSFIVDSVGIKAVRLRPGRVGRAQAEDGITFVRRSHSAAPFSTRDDLRNLFSECKRLGDEFHNYRREVSEYDKRIRALFRKPHGVDEKHPPLEMPRLKIDLSAIIDALSDRMNRKQRP
jgi:hypothetical protein